jgi:Lrp/AsnC family leucine-responsive transcriptional regulator
MSNLALARRVGLTPTPCQERVKRLERDGYITGYAARLDPGRLDLGLLVFVQVTLDRTTTDVFGRFAAAIRSFSAVTECHMVAGGFDYLLKIRCRDMADYRRILGDELGSIDGIAQTHTYAVMEEIKAETALPV